MKFNNQAWLNKVNNAADDEAFLSLCKELAMTYSSDELERMTITRQWMAGQKYIDSKWKPLYNLLCGALTMQIQKNQSTDK